TNLKFVYDKIQNIYLFVTEFAYILITAKINSSVSQKNRIQQTAVVIFGSD
ncbi:unnamed protein product, partial [Heterotrigona itama]